MEFRTKFPTALDPKASFSVTPFQEALVKDLRASLLVARAHQQPVRHVRARDEQHHTDRAGEGVDSLSGCWSRSAPALSSTAAVAGKGLDG
jgi:hypothetical protein